MVKAGITTILTIVIASAGIIIYFFPSSIPHTITGIDIIIIINGVNIFFFYLALISG
jgi:hypothetical protein